MKQLCRAWGIAGILPALRGMLPRILLHTSFTQRIRHHPSAVRETHPAKCRTVRAECSRSPILCVALALCPFIALASDAPVVIGSKKFTESYVLGEIAKRTLTDAGIPAEHRQGMGGTIILWEALRGGQIDVYPEYAGTIATEILKSDSNMSLDQIRASLEKLGVGMTDP